MPDLSTIVLVTVALVMVPCFVCVAKKTIAGMYRTYADVPVDPGVRHGGDGHDGAAVFCPLCGATASKMAEREVLHKCDVCDYRFEPGA